VAEDELWKTLLRFHNEVLKPELDELRYDLTGRLVTRDEFLSHLDAVYKRFDRLESEYQALRMTG
jgi:hypothetical protein